MAKVENKHRLALDGKENSIDMGFAAVQQLTDLEAEASVFRCEGTARGEGSQPFNCFSQCGEPSSASISGAFGNQPLQDGLRLSLERLRCFNQKSHVSG